jgi:hypothetical protein
MRFKQLIAIAIFIYSLAGIFGGAFLVFGQYIIYNGKPVTYPLTGVEIQEFGVLVTAINMIFLLLSVIYLCVYHANDS